MSSCWKILLFLVPRKVTSYHQCTWVLSLQSKVLCGTLFQISLFKDKRSLIRGNIFVDVGSWVDWREIQTILKLAAAAAAFERSQVIKNCVLKILAHLPLIHTYIRDYMIIKSFASASIWTRNLPTCILLPGHSIPYMDLSITWQ